MINKLLLPSTMIMLLILLNTGITRSQVVYNNEIQPIFTAHCTACHSGVGESGVILSSYDAVMNSVGHQYNMHIVVPGEPDESPIVDKINPNPTHGERMPFGGPYLSDTQINLIREWIAEGALETPATNIADKSDLPGKFELLGNYPNPFNPSTNVRFHLPRPASWSVTVYTTTGRFVKEASGWSQAGLITVPLSLEANSSGMYLYVVEMRANETTRSRLSGNMLLIR